MWGTAFRFRFGLLPPLISVGVLSFLAAWTLVSLACVDGGRATGLIGLNLQEFDSTFVFTYPDFNWDSLHPVEPPPAERQIGSLFYRAEVIPEDTSLDSDPMSLLTIVRVRNPTAQNLELPVHRCAVRPEVYASPARSEEPLWVPTAGGCAWERHPVTLAPGATAEFSFLAHDAMLAHALPDGRYYFTARFGLLDETLALPAGSADVRLRVPGLAYRVRLRSEGRRAIRVEVTLMNRNQRRARLTYGDCSVGINLYRDEDRQELVPRGEGRVCLLYLAHRDLEPGDSLRPDEFAESFSLSSLVGVSQERAPYFSSVSLWHNSRTYEFPAGVLTFYPWRSP